MTLAKRDPFAALLRRAAALPKDTGESQHYRARLASGGRVQVVLADVSASMAETAGSSRRIDVLRQALVGAGYDHLLAFQSHVTPIASAELLPQPSGGTALHLALDAATKLNPARTLVVSDGEPDSESAALDAAAALPGTIDVIYCGPEGNHAARDFLLRLARAGGGRFASYDLNRGPSQLGPGIHTLLLGPRS